MSEGKYIRLGTVAEVRDSMGHTVEGEETTIGVGTKKVSWVGYSIVEQKILDFIRGMEDDSDVHIEVSKDLWR